MNCLSISLFGRFNAYHNSDILFGLDAAKLQELFSYLLIYRDRPHYREQLATLLWDAKSTTQSKKYLRQALWQLRQHLESCYGEESVLLQLDGDWVYINMEAPFWLDVNEFEKTFNAVREVPGHEISAEAASQIKKSVQLYKGSLLEGWYQDWCNFERERFQLIYLSMLDKLMSYCANCGDYEEGVAYAILGLRQDPAQERTHQQLMRLHYLSGNRSGALRQYKICEEILQSELSVAPSRMTQLLYAQIQGDQLPTPADKSFPQSASPTGTLQTLAEQLNKLRIDIDLIQHQVQNQLDMTGKFPTA